MSVLRKLGYSGHFYTSDIKSSREESFRRGVFKRKDITSSVWANLQFRMIWDTKADIRRYSLLIICIKHVRIDLNILVWKHIYCSSCSRNFFFILLLSYLTKKFGDMPRSETLKWLNGNLNPSLEDHRTTMWCWCCNNLGWEEK